MKKKDKLINIVIFICIFILIILAISVFISKQNSVDSESEQVKETYSILGDNNLELCNGLPFYQGRKNTKLANSIKLCLASRMIDDKEITSENLSKTKKSDYCYLGKDNEHGFRLDENKETCNVQIISKDLLNKKYHEIFGEDIKAHVDFAVSNERTCYYDEEKGSYTCGNSIKQTFTLGWTPTTYRIITKVKEKGNKLYIYDYYILINDDKCYQDNDGIKENIKCSDQYDKKTKINSKFVIKYGTKYIHIFKKDKNGNYFWQSTKLG